MQRAWEPRKSQLFEGNFDMRNYLSQIGLFATLGAVLCTGIAFVNEFTDTDPFFATITASGMAFFLGFGIMIPSAHQWEDALSDNAKLESERYMLLGMLGILASACLLASYSILWAAVIGLPLLVGGIIWHGKRRLFSNYVVGQEFGLISPAVFLGFAAYMAGPGGSVWTFLQQMVMVHGLIAISVGVVWAFCCDDAKLAERMASK